jgi:hypothetical protein
MAAIGVIIIGVCLVLHALWLTIIATAHFLDRRFPFTDRRPRFCPVYQPIQQPVSTGGAPQWRSPKENKPRRALVYFRVFWIVACFLLTLFYITEELKQRKGRRERKEMEEFVQQASDKAYAQPLERETRRRPI